MRAILKIFATSLLLVTGSIQSAQAVVMINVSEVGGGVQLDATGSLDLTGLTNFSLSSGQAMIGPGAGYLLVGGPSSGSALLDLYTGFTGPSTFGSGGFDYRESASGTLVGVTNYGNWLALTNGFYGGAVNSTAFFASTTIAALGMTPGTHTWSWSGDSISLVVPGGSTVVPVPAALPLLLGGFGVLGAMGWRRKAAV